MRKKMILVLGAVLSLLLPSCQKATFDQTPITKETTSYTINPGYAWVHIEGNYQIVPVIDNGIITSKTMRICDFWIGDPGVAVKASTDCFNIVYVSYVKKSSDLSHPFESKIHEIVVSQLTSDSIYIFYYQNTRDGFNPYYYNFPWYYQSSSTSKTSTSTSAN